ncbi:MAG: DUF3108 domain-containing protein [Gemmatimonadales bacterium]
MSILVMALVAAQATSAPPPPAVVPFGVGERLEYKAKWTNLGVSVGRAVIEVASIDTVRETPAYRFRYTLNASVPLFRISSQLESWTATATLNSLRYRQESKENDRHYVRRFEIYPDSARYQQIEPELQEPKPTVEDPLDDASVLYFLRTTPLEVGQTYRFNRYFRADRNPITIKVLKRETMELPDGSKVPCLVINPVVGERGLFAPRTNARLWLTDDARRIPVQIRSEQPFGVITLQLDKIQAVK